MCKEKKIKPTELIEAVDALNEALKKMPSKGEIWMRLAESARREHERLTKLIHIKIEMSAKYSDVSDVDFQILFSRIRIKVLNEILNDEI